MAGDSGGYPVPKHETTLQHYVTDVLHQAQDFSEALKDLTSALGDLKTSLSTKITVAEQDNKQRHLVINLDINKTVLMRDKATGKDVKEIVNEVLADSAWGVVIDDAWIVKTTRPTVHRPPQKDDSGLDVVSYNEWLATKYQGSKAKKERNKKAGIFTDEGEPGHALKHYANWLSNNLRDSTGAPVQLIPAFFELMLRLKREKRSFTIVFRTFGDDLMTVCEELNSFCEGRHPLHPGTRMDGSDGDHDYRVKLEHPSQCGTFYRDDDTMAIVMGSWDSPEREKDPSRQNLTYYDNIVGSEIFEGDVHQIYEFLHDKCMKPGTMALRDYFPYWKSKEMAAEAGKLLFYDLSSVADCHWMFFDDNIRYSNAYIVDAKAAYKDGAVPFIASLLQSHIVRAEPLESIMDKDYFVNHVARLEKGYDRKVKARSRLIKVLRLAKTMRFASRAFQIPAGPTPNEGYDAWEGVRKNDSILPVREYEDVASPR